MDGGASWLDADVWLNADKDILAYSSAPQITSSGDSLYTVWAEGSSYAGLDIFFTIPFGAQTYGDATAGSGGISPRLDGTDSLTLGSTFTLCVSDGLGGSVGVLALGGPASKAAIPLAGGTLLIDPIELAVPILLGGAPGVPGAGTFSIQVPIPVDNAFLGFNLNMQAAVLDPAGTEGLTLTNAVEAWIL